MQFLFLLHVVKYFPFFMRISCVDLYNPMIIVYFLCIFICWCSFLFYRNFFFFLLIYCPHFFFITFCKYAFTLFCRLSALIFNLFIRIAAILMVKSCLLIIFFCLLVAPFTRFIFIAVWALLNSTWLTRY